MGSKDHAATVPVSVMRWSPAPALHHVGGWVIDTCGTNGHVMMAINTTKRRADLYYLGPMRGTKTTITRFGQVPGTWVGRLATGNQVTSAFDI